MAAAKTDAVVRDRGYSGYDGPRDETRGATVLGVHTAIGLINRKSAKRALGLAWVAAIVTGVVVYIEGRVTGAKAGAMYPLDLLTHPYGVLGPTLFAALIAAGGTIAEDRRAGALPFFFARPLRPIDYLRGRAGGVFAVMLVLAAAPVTAVALFRLSLCSGWSDALQALGVAAIVAAMGICFSAIVTVYAMLASAIAGSRGAAQGLVGAIFVFPWVLAGVGGNVLDGPWASIISVPHLIESAAKPLIERISGPERNIGEILLSLPAGGSHDPHIPPLVALGAMIAIALGGYALLRARIETLGRAGGAAGGGA